MKAGFFVCLFLVCQILNLRDQKSEVIGETDKNVLPRQACLWRSSGVCGLHQSPQPSLRNRFLHLSMPFLLVISQVGLCGKAQFWSAKMLGIHINTCDESHVSSSVKGRLRVRACLQV